MEKRWYAMIIGCLLCATAAMAEEEPAFKQVVDDPSLPRVLLIGDSISIGYTAVVRELLSGKANIHRPPENCQSTVFAVEKLKDWLGDGKWDVIHFNWGIWDTHHFADGSARTTPEQYEKNLRELVSILKSTKAKLIWASSTPLETRQHGDLSVKETDIHAYNAIAEKVMRENDIPIDDLFTAVSPHLGEYRMEDGCHFNPAGCEFLAQYVVKSISTALGIQETQPEKEQGQK